VGLTANSKDNAVGTGLPDVAAEAVQILGQIVVDRASQAAYRMLADKIEEGLRCLNGDGTANPNTQFPPPVTPSAAFEFKIWQWRGTSSCAR